ncbi:MAG TPA: ATP-binding protein [Ornithinibacter sp.]|nr:ATP-binding protein [Ornithinibacter sp.]
MRETHDLPAAGARLLLVAPSGTGTALAARAVAAAVGSDLLTVDVSRVVSKWIGETEKNLAAVFDTAERSRAVLFLDEADALFGTRTEVSDAHDRYANLETAWLLQRIERFEGIVVLATCRRPVEPPRWLTVLDADGDDSE